MNYKKYKRGYFNAPSNTYEWVKKEYIDKAPIWCSVDLRDGNQALITPMSLEEKLEFFKLLVEIGFKEIEVGFPAASETEFNFLRRLIDDNLIPEDVTIQVLTQAREHIIKKTFEAIDGAKNIIVHVYNSTSFAQREQVFRKSKEEILDIAVKGAQLLADLSVNQKGNIRFEYSPESFTGTEVDYALDVCNAVLDVWKPTADKKAIINLPVTVEMSLPHIYANQIEYMSKNLHFRENVIISLHPHNDRGTAVADTELALLAGGDRVEGTLFGNGERTGNVDIVTVAMNMYSHGVDPLLNLSNIPEISEVYENCTKMKVYERQPYSGRLVFAAFSGSHQDAIAKGIHFKEENNVKYWTVPYLPIDPLDVNRSYETDVIRINSQSGKGGVSYILSTNYGIELPMLMREEVGYLVKDISDHSHKELTSDEVYNCFLDNYVNIESKIELIDYHYFRVESSFKVVLSLKYNGQTIEITESGNGRLDAVSSALKRLGFKYKLITYSEHALESGSKSKAISYVALENEAGKVFWGVGIHEDIIASTIKALFSAVNKI